MVKETTASVPKKRRKATGGSENAEEVDMYEKAIKFEEQESEKRTLDEDTAVLADCCTKIRALLSEIHDLKKKGSTENASALKEKGTQICNLTVVMRKLNRLEKIRAARSRETIHLEKQKVDSTHLQLQNLLYESQHLVSEFRKCKQFKSQDADIELVPLEQFLKEAPKETTKPYDHINSLDDLADNANKHQLYLARLEFELLQRQELEQHYKTRQEEKKLDAEVIMDHKRRLMGLKPKIETVLVATRPLQEHLGMPVEKVVYEHKKAWLLPRPLFLLYSNADGYKKVYGGDNMTLEIEGDEEEALQWKGKQSSLSANSMDSDGDNEQEDQVEVKKRRHRKASHIDRYEEKKKRILEAHPFSIVIVVGIENGAVIKLIFSFRPILNVVTVQSSVTYSNNITGDSAREVLSAERILGELVRGDFGIDSPNPAVKLHLSKIGYKSYRELVAELGHVYNWAQQLCGIDFITAPANKNEANELSLATMEVVMKAIKTRLICRADLANQLQLLDQNMIPAIPDDLTIPTNAIANLSKWTISSYQDFCQNDSATFLLEQGLIEDKDLFYSTMISRPKGANLYVNIAIKSDYPKQAPIFSLNMKFGGNKLNARDDSDLKDMERAINVGWDNKPSSAGWLLAAQLKLLCALFDVFLETKYATQFTQNAVFFHGVGGRNRKRPFVFQKIGAGIFTQF